MTLVPTANAPQHEGANREEQAFRAEFYINQLSKLLSDGALSSDLLGRGSSVSLDGCDSCQIGGTQNAILAL